MSTVLFYVLSLISFSSAAQTSGPLQIPEVVVKAETENPNLESQEVLVKSEDQDLAETLLELPNFYRTGGANRSRFFQIRGFGDREQFEHSQVNPVGVFYQGIDLSEEASALPLISQEKLNVKFGPQTQNWGSKAIAGSVEVENCLILDCRKSLNAGIGSFNTYSAGALLPFYSNNKAFLIGASYLKSDGPFENLYFDKSTHDQDEVQVVGGGNYKFEKLQFMHNHLLSHHDNGYDTWTFNAGFDTLSDHPGKDRHFIHGHSFELKLPTAGGEWKNLTSVTLTQQIESYDEDWGNNLYWNGIPGYNADYNYYSNFERHRTKIHEKLSYHWNSGWGLGIHYYEYDEKQIVRSYQDENFRRFLSTELQSENSAVWLSKEGSYLNSNWKVSARGERQEVELKSNVPATEEFGMWGADIEVNTQHSEKFKTGSLIQKAYRGGGFNLDPTLPKDSQSFGSEDLYSTQVTALWTPQDFSLLFRAFHYWFENQQLKSSVQLDPMDPSSYLYFTSNTGTSWSRGAELSLEKTWQQFRTKANIGILKAENSLSPSWNYLIRGEYYKGGYSLYSELKAWGPARYSIDHEFKSDQVELVEVGTSYETSNWRYSFWVRNLFDKNYDVRAYYFANEPPAWQEKLYRQRAWPRHLGLDIAYEF